MKIQDDDLKDQKKRKKNSRTTAQTRVRALVKKSQYQAYLNAGLSPMEAAKKVGIKGLKFWKFYKPGEVQKRIEQQLEEGGN